MKKEKRKRILNERIIKFLAKTKELRERNEIPAMSATLASMEKEGFKMYEKNRSQ